MYGGACRDPWCCNIKQTSWAFTNRCQNIVPWSWVKEFNGLCAKPRDWTVACTRGVMAWPREASMRRTWAKRRGSVDNSMCRPCTQRCWSVRLPGTYKKWVKCSLFVSGPRHGSRQELARMRERGRPRRTRFSCCTEVTRGCAYGGWHMSLFQVTWLATGALGLSRRHTKCKGIERLLSCGVKMFESEAATVRCRTFGMCTMTVQQVHRWHLSTGICPIGTRLEGQDNDRGALYQSALEESHPEAWECAGEL